jgi:uncharacterized protein (TIGR02118 family)
MYPNGPKAKFDHDYYREKHLPLIKSRMGEGLKYYAIDKGLAGGAPDSLAPFVGMCHLLCESLDTYKASHDPHAQEIRGDIRNFTDVTPVVQISEVVVENSAKG